VSTIASCENGLKIFPKRSSPSRMRDVRSDCVPWKVRSIPFSRRYSAEHAADVLAALA
jgi:hypothetical protein